MEGAFFWKMKFFSFFENHFTTSSPFGIWWQILGALSQIPNFWYSPSLCCKEWTEFLWSWLIPTLLWSHMAHEWGRWWRETPSCRQTKLWVPTPAAVGRLVTKVDRGKLGKIIQAITGHNYHRFILQESLTDKCRFCDKAHEEFVHLVCECTALTKERTMLHKYGNICDPQGLRSLLSFILVDHIEEAMSPMG